jgi:hypothetical protein
MCADTSRRAHRDNTATRHGPIDPSVYSPRRERLHATHELRDRRAVIRAMHARRPSPKQITISTRTTATTGHAFTPSAKRAMGPTAVRTMPSTKRGSRFPILSIAGAWIITARARAQQKKAPTAINAIRLLVTLRRRMIQGLWRPPTEQCSAERPISALPARAVCHVRRDGSVQTLER